MYNSGATSAFITLAHELPAVQKMGRVRFDNFIMGPASKDANSMRYLLDHSTARLAGVGVGLNPNIFYNWAKMLTSNPF